MIEISELWKKETFTTKRLDFIFNKEITEYDIKEGGYSVSKEYDLLTSKQKSKLKEMSKEQRHYELGYMQKRDKQFAKALTEAFRLARREFYIRNELEDIDIISNKKDAIFVMKSCPVQRISENILFREKNRYTSFLHIQQLEFYYGRKMMEPHLDVKGIKDEVIVKHEGFMLDFIMKYIRHLEESNVETQMRFIRRFADRYKNRELPLGYYREFNANSNYLTYEGDAFDDYWDDSLADLFIDYNYMNIIIPLIKIII